MNLQAPNSLARSVFTCVGLFSLEPVCKTSPSKTASSPPALLSQVASLSSLSLGELGLSCLIHSDKSFSDSLLSLPLS